MQRLARKAEYVIGASATPAPNSPTNLITAFANMMCPAIVEQKPSPGAGYGLSASMESTLAAWATKVQHDYKTINTQRRKNEKQYEQTESYKKLGLFGTTTRANNTDEVDNTGDAKQEAKLAQALLDSFFNDDGLSPQEMAVLRTEDAARHKYLEQRQDLRLNLASQVLGPIRSQLGPYFVRRTKSTKDYLGEPIRDRVAPNVKTIYVKLSHYLEAFQKFSMTHKEQNNFQTLQRRWTTDPSAIEKGYLDLGSPTPEKTSSLIEGIKRIYTEDAHLPEPEQRKIVVFQLWTGLVPMVRGRLAHAGIMSSEITGLTEAVTRAVRVAEFQNPASHMSTAITVVESKTKVTTYKPTPCRLIFITKVGSDGLNLHRASELFMLDPVWSDLDRKQVEGRIDRRGQTRPVNFYQIVVHGTTDEWMLRLSKGKSTMSEMLLQGPEGVGRSTHGPTHAPFASTSEGRLPGHVQLSAKTQRENAKRAEKRSRAMTQGLSTPGEIEDKEVMEEDKQEPEAQALQPRSGVANLDFELPPSSPPVNPYADEDSLFGDHEGADDNGEDDGREA